MRRFSLFVLAVLFLSFPAVAGAPQAKVYGAQQAFLSNGMEVVVVPVHRVPAVTHMVWYKAGAGEEPWGVSGTAHFMEHLMFKGTPLVPAGVFSSRIQRMGGNDNAFTSYDYTAYFQTVPKEKLGDVMRMEAERMTDLTPKLADIFSEKQVVMEERRQTTESDPGAILIERMRQALFPNHPYGRPVIGWMPEMKALKWVDALAFYRRWYAPNNAILVVSGDVTMDDVLPLAEQSYGRLPRKDIPARARPVSPVLPGDVRVSLARPDVREREWMRMIRVPSQHQDGRAALSLSLLEDLLGGASGRLYQALVVRDKIATDIDVDYDSLAWDDGTFTIHAIPAAGVSPDQLEKAVDRELDRIAAKGFSQDEVKKAIGRLQDESVYARDSLAGPAMTIGYALASGVSLDDVETWPSRLEGLRPGDAKTALDAYVRGRKGVSGVLVPEENAP